jgi:hypothetical protein
VRAFGGRRFCPASSPKTIHAPVAAASLVFSPASGSARRRSSPHRAPRPGAPGPAGCTRCGAAGTRCPQGVPDVEQPAGQRGDPGQGPPLILIPAPHRRAAVPPPFGYEVRTCTTQSPVETALSAVCAWLITYASVWIRACVPPWPDGMTTPVTRAVTTATAVAPTAAKIRSGTGRNLVALRGAAWPTALWEPASSTSTAQDGSRYGRWAATSCGRTCGWPTRHGTTPSPPGPTSSYSAATPTSAGPGHGSRSSPSSTRHRWYRGPREFVLTWLLCRIASDRLAPANHSVLYITITIFRPVQSGKGRAV